jgi:hypothetical protein
MPAKNCSKKPEKADRKVRLCLLIWAAWLVFASFSADGQLRVGYDGEVPTNSLTKMQDSFGFSSAAQKQSLLKRLGVPEEIAKPASEPPPENSIRFEELDAEGKTEQALVFVPCGTNTQAFAGLLTRTAGSLWKIRDQVFLDCWGVDVTYELLALPQGKMVLIHYVNAGHGAGTMQEKAVLLLPSADHLLKVMETLEQSSEDILGGVENPVEQTSSFLVFPGGSIEETRSTSRAGIVKAIDRRLWQWSAHESQFQPGTFHSAITRHP